MTLSSDLCLCVRDLEPPAPLPPFCILPAHPAGASAWLELGHTDPWCCCLPCAGALFSFQPCPIWPVLSLLVDGGIVQGRANKQNWRHFSDSAYKLNALMFAFKTVLHNIKNSKIHA